MQAKIDVRPLCREDFAAVVAIDRKVFKTARPEYYEDKFSHALDESDGLVLSLVAESAGTVAGFVMGQLYVGEYGISANTAALDTIGIDPDWQGRGVALRLIEEFVRLLRKVGVKKIYTLVDWGDWRLTRLFNAAGFVPSKTLNLELNID